MSDEQLRKSGRAELDRLNAGAKKSTESGPAKKRPRHQGATWGDLVGIGKKKERRHGPKGKTVDEVVDDAVKNAKPDPY